jgi:uncharacterized protein (DUF169 family)
MNDYGRIERDIMGQLSLQRRPSAITTLDAAPAGVEKFEGVQPSSCSFWRLAAEGRTFYTVNADHYNCPIGAHTHNIPLPAERAHELSDTLSFMTGLGYIRMEEVPAIPRLAQTPRYVLYAPLGDTPVDPEVVLFWGPAGRMMLLQEAAQRSGTSADLNTLGRPTCMVVPAALAHGVVASTGCIGNRVYTGLDENDLYVAVPGRDLLKVAAEIATIMMANNTLLLYHQDRRRQLATV